MSNPRYFVPWGNATNVSYATGFEAKAFGFISCFVVPFEGLMRYCAYGNRPGGLYVNHSVPAVGEVNFTTYHELYQRKTQTGADYAMSSIMIIDGESEAMAMV